MLKVALENGMSFSGYYTRVRKGMSKKEAATLPTKYTGDFAVYKGDTLLAMGTAEECAEKLGVTAEYIRWMTTPSGRNRIANRKNPNNARMAIKLDEEDDE